MTNGYVDTVGQIIVRAVQRAYDAWAPEHPSLASVIDRIELTQQSLESLRQSPGYRQALETYHQTRHESELLGRLTELSSQVLAAILAG